MKNFRFNIILRVLFISLTITFLFYLYFDTQLTATIVIIFLMIIYQMYSLVHYIDTTNRELKRFLDAVKYSDFSQNFSKNKLGGSFKELGASFNEVMKKFQDTRSEKEENYRYLQTVMQHVGIGLVSFNQEGTVEFINNAAKKLLKIQFLNNVNSLDKQHPGLTLQLRSLHTGDKTTIKLVDENELLQVLAYATEFRLRNNNYKLVALQNIQSELEEKEMEAWQKLIRVLTHEIMNSVTPISSLAATVHTIINDINKNGGSFDDETVTDIVSAVATIQKRSEGLIHFVENYRNLTRIPKPNFQIFPVKNLFDRVKLLLISDLKENKIDFSCIVDPEVLELTADPEMIEQVIINMIINSIHALKNTQNPQIRLTAHLDERGRILIRIIDNGPGISDEVLEKIFIPFFSTKKDGSGIGLSLSRQIMRSHGGNIRVVSNPGQETVFTLRF